MRSAQMRLLSARTDDQGERQHSTAADAAEEERVGEQGSIGDICHGQCLLREWRFVKRVIDLSA